jgi:glutaredoxin
MKYFFWLLTIGLICVGFFVPIAWIGAIITAIIAIFDSFFGGVRSNVITSYKMKNCPYCKSKVRRDAQKCPHCAEWLVIQEEPTIEQDDKGNQIKTMKISGFYSINLIDFETFEIVDTKQRQKGNATYNKETDEWTVRIKLNKVISR